MCIRLISTLLLAPLMLQLHERFYTYDAYMAHTVRFVSVILAQGPCRYSPYRSNFDGRSSKENRSCPSSVLDFDSRLERHGRGLAPGTAAGEGQQVHRKPVLGQVLGKSTRVADCDSFPAAASSNLYDALAVACLHCFEGSTAVLSSVQKK